jgi:hypothetical protein
LIIISNYSKIIKGISNQIKNSKYKESLEEIENLTAPDINTDIIEIIDSFQEFKISRFETTINQIISGINNASVNGSTQLPSRDIPRNTDAIMQDPQIQPNYIPEQKQMNDYINDYEKNEEIIKNYNRSEKTYNSLDEMYSEIQLPLLISVLYFLFQLPIFRKVIFKYFPILFMKDGNFNINGYLFTSVIFGFLFYLLSKVIIHASNF